jgi:colanic acid biosynthesis glycosyl transferase WcaI
MRNADVVSTISEGMVKKIQAKSKDIKSPVLFPNWANNEKLFPCTPDHLFYQRYGLPADKRIVLYSGSIGEKQGLDIILETAAALEHQINDVLFVISGTGPYFNVLRQKCANAGLTNLQFLPLLDIEDYNQLLNAAWLHLVIQKEVAADLLMPSKITSIVGAGGAVIVTASPNTSLYHLIHSHQFGWTIAPDHPEALTKKIIQLNAENILIEKAKKNALDYADQYIRKDKVIITFLSGLSSDLQENQTILQTN